MATERSTERLIDIFSFPQHYLKSNEVYLSRPTQQKVALKWIQENLPNVLKRAATKPKSSNAPFKVPGVGCGGGSRGDLLTLEAVANYLSTKEASRPVIFNKAIEPRSKALSILQDSAQGWKKKTNKTKCRLAGCREHGKITKRKPNKIPTNFT